MTAQTASQYTDRSNDYKPKSSSKLPFNFAAIAWNMIDSDQFRSLKGECIKLYVYLARHVNIKDQCSVTGFLRGYTFPKTYEQIIDECFGGSKSKSSMTNYVQELRESGLIETEKLDEGGQIFSVLAYQKPEQIQVFEDNGAVKQDRKKTIAQGYGAPIPQPVEQCTILERNIKETTSNEDQNSQPVNSKSSSSNDLVEIHFQRTMQAWNEQENDSFVRAAPSVAAKVCRDLANHYGAKVDVIDQALEDYIKHKMPDRDQTGGQIKHLTWVSSVGHWNGTGFINSLKMFGHEVETRKKKINYGSTHRRDNESPRTARARQAGKSNGFVGRMGTTTGALLDEIKKESANNNDR